MSEETPKSWIRVYDDRYEDCIVGNKAGLEALSEAIENTLRTSVDSELADFTDSDVSIIHCTEGFDSLQEDSESASLPLQLLGVILFLWITIFPMLGIYWIYQALIK